MEFKFRAAHDRPLRDSSSSSAMGSLSEQALRVGNLKASPKQNPELTLREVLQRLIEKERVRTEIIKELERQRGLEAEVRRELIIEEEVAMRGMSLEERLAVRLNPRLFKPLANESENLLPFLGPPGVEAQPAVKDNKDKLILPTKPDSNLCGAKQEAATPPAGDPSELPFAGLKKKPIEEEWSCALCQVSATNEKGLNHHLQGKKHKAKVAGLRAQKMAKKLVDTTLPKENGKPDSNLSGAKQEAATPPAGDPIELPFAGLKKKPVEEEWSCALCQVSATNEKGLNDHLQGKKHKAKVAGLRTQKMAEKLVNTTSSKENGMKKIFKFWCEFCDIGANSAVVMEHHKKGKKHLAQLQKHVLNGKHREGEWSYTPCQVSAPSEKGLNEHLQGQKPKINVAGLRTQKMAKKLVDATSPKENETMKKFKFWCEICEIRANSVAVMETHKKGKKHLAQLQKQVQNGKVVPSTTSME